MGVLRVLDHTGDTAVTFDPEVADTLEVARALFAELAGEGKLAFARPPGRRPAERIEAFDPTAEEIIFVRPIQGG